ncbi:MAG: hypothetical protein ABSG40_19125 [Terriglobales bacterium]
MRVHALRILAFLLLCVAAVPCRAQDKVTILYDAFGESKELTKDWGYSALVEHNGKRILFDTGNDAAIFEHNVKALGVDLTKLDFVVISHRHAGPHDGVEICAEGESERYGVCACGWGEWIWGSAASEGVFAGR